MRRPDTTRYDRSAQKARRHRTFWVDVIFRSTCAREEGEGEGKEDRDHSSSTWILDWNVAKNPNGLS